MTEEHDLPIEGLTVDFNTKLLASANAAKLKKDAKSYFEGALKRGIFFDAIVLDPNKVVVVYDRESGEAEQIPSYLNPSMGEALKGTEPSMLPENITNLTDFKNTPHAE